MKTRIYLAPAVKGLKADLKRLLSSMAVKGWTMNIWLEVHLWKRFSVLLAGIVPIDKVKESINHYYIFLLIYIKIYFKEIVKISFRLNIIIFHFCLFEVKTIGTKTRVIISIFVATIDRRKLCAYLEIVLAIPYRPTYETKIIQFWLFWYKTKYINFQI